MAAPEFAGPRVTTITVVVAMPGLASAAWLASIQLMSGMDMGPATQLGSFGTFIAAWAVMMTAMMLPGAVPAAARRAQDGGPSAVARFVVAYVGVWTLLGVLVYLLYRPHGTLATGIAVLGAGLYELTPVKRHFRRRCGDCPRSGIRFGLCCAGSTVGLMAMLVALGIMSIPWMAVTGALALAQKLLPARAVLDVPLAFAIIALGCWIILAPASVPGLIPAR
jgi:predicted metal-binding membrane protein